MLYRISGRQQHMMLGASVVLLAMLASWTADAVRKVQNSEQIARIRADKREIAMQGALELERAVQDFKDCILRGDTIYNADFYKHLQAVEAATASYQAAGPLNTDEKYLLQDLSDAVPRYRAAIYTVTQMRERNASIAEIDAAVKGGDRPISAAFAQLESIGGDSAQGSALMLWGARPEILFAALSGVLFMFTLGGRFSPWRSPEVQEYSLRDLTNRAIRWEEEKASRAFSKLHNGVCQSLSAIMYMMTRVSQHGESNLRSQACGESEPIIPSLQAALRETLLIARDLRPPTVGYSGLVETLDSIWFDNRSQVTGLDIDASTSLRERDVPDELKPTILRLAFMSMEWSAQFPRGSKLQWDLCRHDDELRLSIRRVGAGIECSENFRTHGAPFLWEAIRARVILAGGCCAGSRRIPGGQEILATWPAARLH